MPIPPGTKFHGVAPGVETENKGSAVRNVDRDAYTIEEFGGGSPFEYKGSTPASAVLTVTNSGNSILGQTITVGGITATFTNLNPPNPQNSNEIRIGAGSSSLTARNIGWFFNDQGSVQTTPDSISPVIVLDGPSSNQKIFVAVEGGTAGNSIAVSSSLPSELSWSSPTLLGGTDETTVVDDSSGNVYVKAVAADDLTHGYAVYQIGWDTDTGLPLVTHDSNAGINRKDGSKSTVVFGMSIDFDANSSFRTIPQGTELDVCLSGIVKNIYTTAYPATGLVPEIGETLSVALSSTLIPDNGNGLALATMLYPGPALQWKSIVYFQSGITSPFSRPTFDGVSPQATIRTTGRNQGFNGSVSGGSLIVRTDDLSSGEFYDGIYRHYTSSDAALDIVGIAAQTATGTGTDDRFGICMNGLVSSVPLYDATGTLIETTIAPVPLPDVLGDVVYAGDGTINPSHVLTTDPTSGVAVGIIIGTAYQSGVPSNGWTIKFQPYRLVSGGGGGGGNTTGEDLSLNVRTNPYSAAGDHEGTVLSIGTATLTVGTVYYWNGTEWALSNAGAVATADGLMGVATASAAAPDVLVSGIIQMSATGSVGDPLYLDTASGLLTATAPSGSTEIVRVMGYKLDTNRVYFNPSQDWLEIV